MKSFVTMPRFFSKNNALLIVAAVLVAVLVGFAVRQMFLIKREGFEDQVTVTFYKMAGCPHCIDFEPEWTKFKSLALTAGIVPVEKDSKDPSKPDSIRSFPTITIQKGSGAYTEYKGDRTADALVLACKA